MTKLFTLLAAAAAAAITLAPAAGANTDVDCDSIGPASVCSRPGHNSIATQPGDTRANPGFGFWPMAPGAVPPILAVS